MNKRIVAIFICSEAGQLMQKVEKVMALEGKGLEGDRYANRQGSFSRKAKWFFQRWMKMHRQVSLISAEAFPGSGFTFSESRRNIVVEGLGRDLTWLAGKDFQVGDARMRGVKYCEPCTRPNKLCGKSASFKIAFEGCGGLIAQVLESSLILEGDVVLTPPKPHLVVAK